MTLQSARSGKLMLQFCKFWRGERESRQFGLRGWVMVDNIYEIIGKNKETL